MAQEGIGISTKPTKAAKDIKKAKETNLEDREKGWREKPLHWKITLRTDYADVDRSKTHHWLSSLDLKGETEGFIFAAQDQTISIRAYKERILNNGADANCRLCKERERKQ